MSSIFSKKRVSNKVESDGNGDTTRIVSPRDKLNTPSTVGGANITPFQFGIGANNSSKPPN
jgi:hypothetical protein